MISKSSIIAQYSDKSHGLHRSSEESFLELEAREKIFHLGSGQSLLDFGCGSADLSVYYAAHFQKLFGVDISANMIRMAKERIGKFGCENIQVDVADDDKIWTLVAGQKFDVITSAGVLQYFSEVQISNFLSSAVQHLTSDGKIVFFDVIDPRIYWLLNCGLFLEKPMSFGSCLRAFALSGRFAVRRVLDQLGLRDDLMGTAHHPKVLQDHAQKLGLHSSSVRSMYYEYRYHAIITRKVS